MKGSLEMTPDMLAQLVCGVLEANGYKADGLALYLGDQLVGYDRVVVPVAIEQGIEIFPRPQPQANRMDLERMLNPYVAPTGFAARNGSGQSSGN